MNAGMKVMGIGIASVVLALGGGCDSGDQKGASSVEQRKRDMEEAIRNIEIQNASDVEAREAAKEKYEAGRDAIQDLVDAARDSQPDSPYSPPGASGEGPSAPSDEEAPEASYEKPFEPSFEEPPEASDEDA